MAKRQEYLVCWHVNGTGLEVVRFLSGEQKGKPRTWNNRHTALADSERSCYGIPTNATVSIQPSDGIFVFPGEELPAPDRPFDYGEGPKLKDMFPEVFKP